MVATKPSFLSTLLRGVIRYNKDVKPQMSKQLNALGTKPKPKGLFFTCVDARMQPSQFTQTQVGDMFVVRNVGNVVPAPPCCNLSHNEDDKPNNDVDKGDGVTSEAAVMQLACVANDIRDVVVCGHADCKAINAAHGLIDSNKSNKSDPIESWLRRHMSESIDRFIKLRSNEFKTPLKIKLTPKLGMEAMLDETKVRSQADLLSQVHTLVQLEHVAQHEFMQERILSGASVLHAFWFDVLNGDVYVFSKRSRGFEILDDNNLEEFVQMGIATE